MVISRVKRTLSKVIIAATILRTLLTTTHEPPSRVTDKNPKPKP